MGTIIQYFLLSIIIVVLWHFLSDILSKEEDDIIEKATYDFTERNEEREKIMSLMREDEQLEEYLKSKLKQY